MKILDTNQIRELDAYTIQHEPISSIDLMERASRAFVDWFTLHFPVTKKVGVVCGTGNNGGDGLAIARMLHEWEFPVQVWIVKGGAPESDDFRVNQKRLSEKIVQREIRSETEDISFSGCDVLIDAIFGSGLSRPAAGVYASVIHLVNKAPALRIAVDIPSGLMADAPSSGPIVKADHTVTFQLPKLSFLFPETYAYTGDWETVDIGLHKDFIKKAEVKYFYTRMKDVRRILKVRKKHDHKGTFGHALLVAGSYGKMGAAVLASRAALRAGLGLLTTHIPKCGYNIIQSTVPEAMVLVDHDEEIFTGAREPGRYTTVAVGPGLGQDARTIQAFTKLLEECDKPMVLDADALNILSTNRHLLGLLPAGSILTPHPKEFERLVGPWKNDFERLALQQQMAADFSVVVVLKGAHTAVATPEGEVYFNSTGNPGMGTAGSGDVLTGVLAGLLAQNYSPVEAAIAGVFLHGFSGDLAVDRCGMESLIASDLITQLPAAFLKVLRK